MITNLEITIERPEDGKIHLSFLNDPAMCIRKTEYGGKQLNLMSYQLITAFLVKVGIERANFSTNEAKLIAHKAVLSHKPTFVTAKDIKSNYHCCAYSRHEFNLIYQYYLITCCKVDPFDALGADEDEVFWCQFFPEAEQYNPPLPKLYGNPEDIERARLVQRRQVADLRILKESVVNRVDPTITESTEGTPDKDKAHSISLAHQLMKAHLTLYIDSLIQRPRAEDWFSVDDLFKYNSDWLNNIEKEINDETERWRAEVNYQYSDYLLKYPVLYSHGWAAIELDWQSTDWQVRIVNHRVSRVLTENLFGEVEITENALTIFFLMSLGVKIAQLEPMKACNLALEATGLWKDKLKLKFVKAYTRSELFDVSQYYLEECCNFSYAKSSLLEHTDKFWRLLFPDTKPFYRFLPTLIGEQDEVAQAELIRTRQVHDLLILLDYIDLNGHSIIAEDQILSASNNNLTNYINEIINRSQAKDWITTKSITYDLAWLRHEMAKHDFISPTKLIDVQLGK